MDIQISEKLNRKQLTECIDVALQTLEDKGVSSYEHTNLVMNPYQKDSADIYHIRDSQKDELVRLILHYNKGDIKIEEVVVEPAYAVVREMNSGRKKREVVAKFLTGIGAVFLLWVAYIYFKYGWKEVVSIFPFAHGF